MSDQQQTGDASAFDDGAYQQAQPTPPARPPLPGAVLAAERRAKGWSIEYVASHLKLATRQIHALEEDRFEALPGAVVVRGFVRIYAKMLGIDSTALIAALPAGPAPAQEQIVPARSLSTPFSESSLPLRGRSDFPVGRLVWAALGVLLIAGIYGAMRFGVWSQVKDSPLLQRLHMSAAAAPAGAAAAAEARDKEDVELPAVADRENTLPAETAPTAQPESPAAAGAISAPPANSSAVAATQFAPETPAAAQPATPTALADPANPAPSQTSPQAPSAVAGPHALRLTMSQDSWVDIRRADKSVVVSRVLKAGTTESFDIDQPVSIVIGNVGGVTATFRGRAFDLVSSYGNNVARMNLK